MFTKRQSRRIGRAGGALGMLAVAGLVLTGCSGINNAGSGDGSTEETITWTLATMNPSVSPQAALQDWFLDRVEEVTEGRLTFDRTAPEVLCKAAEIVDCVRDGRAQIGSSVPDYTPQYFPSTSMVSIPFVNQNSQAVMQSIYDLHTSYEPAMEVMERNGLHHVATWPVGRVLVGSHEPVTGADQFQGLQMRVSGPIIQQALTDQGANIVAIPAADTYESVERGVISTVGGSLDFPVSYKLMELLPHWTDPGVGQYSVMAMWVNVDAYEALPDDLRELFDQVTLEVNSGAGVDVFNERAADLCQQMLDSPTVQSLTAWDEAATDAWETELGDQGKEMWIKLATEQGLTNAEGVLEEYLAGLERYKDAEYEDASLSCITSFANR